MACAGGGAGELTMPQHTCGMPQDAPHKVLSIAAVATRCCCCCLVSLLCAYFHSNIYSCKNLWLPHGQLSNTLTKSVQIPQCVSLFYLFLSFSVSVSSQKSHLIWTWHSAPYAPSPGPVPDRNLHASWICGTTSCMCNGRN